MSKIQFYLSEDIVLRREVRQGDTRIREGKIKIVNGRKVEEIVFKSGTPGIFLFSPKEDRMAVSFEEGGDKRYLMFGPNPKAGNRYVLLAKNWNRKRGEVSYDDRIYTTTSESAFGGLLVDIEKAKKLSVKSRKAKGRTVD